MSDTPHPLSMERAIFGRTGPARDVTVGSGVISAAALVVTALVAPFNFFAFGGFDNIIFAAYAAVAIYLITDFAGRALVAIPYFEKRRPGAMKSVWLVVYVCIFVSAISAVYAIYKAPEFSPVEAAEDLWWGDKARPIADIARDAGRADRRCSYAKSECINLWYYRGELNHAKRLVATAPAPAADTTIKAIVTYLALALYTVLLVAIRNSRILFAEAWQEICESQKDTKPVAPPVAPPPADSLTQKIKEGFDNWVSTTISWQEGAPDIPAKALFVFYQEFCARSRLQYYDNDNDIGAFGKLVIAAMRSYPFASVGKGDKGGISKYGGIAIKQIEPWKTLWDVTLAANRNGG